MCPLPFEVVGGTGWGCAEWSGVDDVVSIDGETIWFLSCDIEG